MTTVAHTLLTRLQAVEAEAREAMRAARFALDDMATAHETARQLRVELAAVPGVDDASVGADVSEVPDPHTYARIILGSDPCGRMRR